MLSLDLIRVFICVTFGHGVHQHLKKHLLCEHTLYIQYILFEIQIFLYICTLYIYIYTFSCEYVSLFAEHLQQIKVLLLLSSDAYAANTVGKPVIVRKVEII